MTPRLEAFARALRAVSDDKARYQELLVLAGDCPAMNPELKTDANKVVGCTSTVHVHAALEDAVSGRIRFEGDSDAQLTRGLVSMLVRGLSGHTCEEICAVRPEFITYAGIATSLTPGRNSGFLNMLRLMQRKAREIDEARTTNSGSATAIASSSSSSNRVMLEAAGALTGPAVDPRGAEVAVLLSGGVDSSVALQLLREQGHTVRAFYLKIWLEDEVAHLNECPWEEDLRYAQEVCSQLHVPLESVSLQKEYWSEVVQYTFQEARQGRTPNPDIMCNSRIKFGMFYEHVGRHFSRVATGHYAQVRLDGGEPGGQIDTLAGLGVHLPALSDSTGPRAVLSMSPDPVKDQTYFLCNLQQAQLQKALFPIGHLAKPSVRQLAESSALATMRRKDSQGICFLGKLRFDEFILHYLGENPGDVRCYATGRVLGQHRGLWFHTVGQRKGVGPGLHAGVVDRGPWYVAGKDAGSNTLFITNDLRLVEAPRRCVPIRLILHSTLPPHPSRTPPHSSSLPRLSPLTPFPCPPSPLREFFVQDINWILGEPRGLEQGGEGLVLDVRLRHGPSMARGLVRRVGSLALPPSLPAPSSSSAAYPGPGVPAGMSAQVQALAPASVGLWHVTLEERDKGIAPGQFAAFYAGSVCLGAGMVSDQGGGEAGVGSEPHQLIV